MDKLNGMSLDLLNENTEIMKNLFPSVVSDGKIDFDQLKALLGELVDETKERYQFTWNGKRESIKLAQLPSSATLRPCISKSKNWNQTENLFIEGDNLEVLKLLQKTYYNRIKMIYIDPPYNTGEDFVYRDNYRDTYGAYVQQTEQYAESNPESNGRYHSAWLNLIFPRLLVARNLLSDDGVIFISIDDHEVENLVRIADEVFGESNRLAILVWKKKYTGGKGASGFADYHEYILAYAKHEEMIGDISMARPDDEKGKFTEVDEYVETRGKYYTRPLKSNLDPRPTLTYPIELPDGNSVTTQWICARETYDKLLSEGRIEFKMDGNSKYPVYKKFYEKDGEGNVKIPSFIEVSNNNEAKEELKKIFDIEQTRDLPFSTPKPTKLLRLFIDNFTSSDDIILDFFAGSASTADAIMQSNAEDGNRRKYILVQLPEKCPEDSPAAKLGFKTIDEIGEKRIDIAGDMLLENNKQQSLFASTGDNSVDIGYKVFQMDSTNINPWDNTAEYDENTIYNSATVFKLDRSKEDILYEIMLKYGVFDQPVFEVNVNGKNMYRVGQRHMIVCLEDNIDSSDIAEICKLSPRVVVFKEDGFSDDNAKINAEYNLKNAGIEDIKCI